MEGRKKERAKKSYGGKTERRGKMNGGEEMRGASVSEPVCCQRRMVVVEVAGDGTLTMAVDPGGPSKLAGHHLARHPAVCCS